MKPFSAERLIVRPTNLEDAKFIFELLNLPKWLKFIGDRNLKTVKDAENYIKLKMLPQLERLGFSNNTILRKKDNLKIGTCGLCDREGINGVDIGFAFLPEFENQGFAFEASSKLTLLAKEQFNIKKINAITTKENTSSQKLIKKLGLKFDKMISIPNDDEEMMLFVNQFYF